MNSTLRNLPNLISSKDLKNLTNLMKKLRESGKEAYLVNNSKVEAIVIPVPIFDQGEEAQNERDKYTDIMEQEIEQLWSQQPDIERVEKGVTKDEMRKYAY